MFKKPLIAVDNSENSLRAVWAIRNLYDGETGPVTLLYVMPPVPEPVQRELSRLALGRASDVNLTALMERHGEEILAPAKEILSEAGIPVETVTEVGKPGEVICTVAREGDYDVVILGRRGLTPLQKLLVGSVTEYVVRHSPIPVLVIQ